MKVKINGVTYTGIRKNSLAWYVLGTVKAIGYLIMGLAITFGIWAFVSFAILMLG